MVPFSQVGTCGRKLEVGDMAREGGGGCLWWWCWGGGGSCTMHKCMRRDHLLTGVVGRLAAGAVIVLGPILQAML